MNPLQHSPQGAAAVAMAAATAAMAQQLLQPSDQITKLAVLLLGFARDDVTSWARQCCNVELQSLKPNAPAEVYHELRQLAAVPAEAFKAEPAGHLHALLSRLYASATEYEKTDEHMR
jgi:hypothetical protein